MKTLTTCIFLMAIVIQPSDSKVEFDGLKKEASTTIQTSKNPSTMTITKLKKPWYAWRGLVVKKMKETIPEYKKVKGLDQKYYTFTSDLELIGGIYLWDSQQNADAWLNEEWHHRVEEKYGEKAIVLTFKISDIHDYKKPSSNEGRFYAALSYSSETTTIIWSEKNAGLLEVIELKDSNDMTCFLSIWDTKKNAESFLNIYGVTNEYFDVPLILNY